jgi:uncharacterized protein YecE (DUF72 family)
VAEGVVRIGTSGYQYRHWRGVFYPNDLPVRQWLAHYVRQFDTVELNATFYGLPRPEVFDAWRAQAPPGFLYALKFSRYGSHFKHLRDPERTVPAFLEMAHRLGGSLGPILAQLPPRWRVDPARLATFLDQVRGHGRWAVEFRDPSWLCEKVYRILEARGVALCLHDWLEEHPLRLTTDWTYLRFHGDHYQGSYAPAEIRNWAERIHSFVGRGVDVYGYFNNDQAGHAVADARQLLKDVAALRGSAG